VFDWRIGLAVVVALVLIPVVMIAVMAVRIIAGMITQARESREAEARRVNCDLPGLGEFTSTDGCDWDNGWSRGDDWDADDHGGLMITIMTAGGPPTEEQSAALRELLDGLSPFVAQSQAFLLEHEDCSWLEGGAQLFELDGVEFQNSLKFVLEFSHPADVDGGYRVTFDDGVPVRSGRDD
jgi:hypothetical protein